MPGPTEPTIIALLSNLIIIFFCSLPKFNILIATKFGRWHNSHAVMAYVRFCKDLTSRNRNTAITFSIQFKFWLKNRPWNQPPPYYDMVPVWFWFQSKLVHYAMQPAWVAPRSNTGPLYVKVQGSTQGMWHAWVTMVVGFCFQIHTTWMYQHQPSIGVGFMS